MLKNKLFIGITVLICSAGLFATGANWENDNKKDSLSVSGTIKDRKKSLSPIELPFTNDEKNNTAIFEKASPSVVFVTNTKLRRQRFSLNVSEIPQRHRYRFHMGPIRNNSYKLSRRLSSKQNHDNHAFQPEL